MPFAIASETCTLSMPAVPGAARNFSGSFSNRSAQRFEQKKYVLPPYSTFPAGFAASTIIPQTGSFSFGPSRRTARLGVVGFASLVAITGTIGDGLGVVVAVRYLCGSA